MQVDVLAQVEALANGRRACAATVVGGDEHTEEHGHLHGCKIFFDACQHRYLALRLVPVVLGTKYLAADEIDGPNGVLAKLALDHFVVVVLEEVVAQALQVVLAVAEVGVVPRLYLLVAILL